MNSPAAQFAFFLAAAGVIVGIFWLAEHFRRQLAARPKMKHSASSDHVTADYTVKTGGRLVFSINLRTAREEGKAITGITYHMSPEQKQMYRASEHTEAVHMINRTISDRHKVTLFHVFVFRKDEDASQTVESCWRYQPGKRPVQIRVKDGEAKPKSPLYGPGSNRIIRPT